MELQELIARWDTGEGKPYKGQLIDWSAYEAEPDGLSCMCAQGQVLYAVGGWEPQLLRSTAQSDADRAVAELLNISIAHAILLRNVNDNVDGAPSVVLTDLAKVLGSEWSKLLDFWWHLDKMTWDAARAAARAAARDAARAASWAAAGDAARAASWAAAGDAARAASWAAAGVAARVAANAASEIQGARLLRERGKPFFFLPMFGFASPDDIPARPENYGGGLRP